MAVPAYPSRKYSAASRASTTFSAGDITGADHVYFRDTAATPGTVTTRTAAQMINDAGAAGLSGLPFVVRIINGGSAILTVGAGTGVTITGTATIAAGSWRDFLVSFTGWPGTQGSAGNVACTMQSLGGGSIDV